jgi:hypothetical protein
MGAAAYAQPMTAIRAMQRMNQLPSPPPTVLSLTYLRHTLASALLTGAAAVCSPTAILHSFTGVTLLMGYVHARELLASAQLAPLFLFLLLLLCLVAPLWS